MWPQWPSTKGEQRDTWFSSRLPGRWNYGLSPKQRSTPLGLTCQCICLQNDPLVPHKIWRDCFHSSLWSPRMFTLKIYHLWWPNVSSLFLSTSRSPDNKFCPKEKQLRLQTKVTSFAKWIKRMTMKRDN